MARSTHPQGDLDRVAKVVAAALAVTAVVAVLTAARLALADSASWAEIVGENEATNAILGVTFGLLGGLAVAERPRNALSWLFVAEGQANALAVLGGAGRPMRRTGGPRPRGRTSPPGSVPTSGSPDSCWPPPSCR